MKKSNLEGVTELLTARDVAPSSLNDHAFLREVRNTFEMDRGHHLDTDPLRHYVARQARIAIETHGTAQRIQLSGTFPKEAPFPHRCSFGIYYSHDGDGGFTIADEPTFEGTALITPTDRMGFLIYIIGPATMSQKPIEDSLHASKYR